MFHKKSEKMKKQFASNFMRVDKISNLLTGNALKLYTNVSLWPLWPYALAFAAVILIIYLWSSYRFIDDLILQEGIRIELFGVFFDVIILGVLVTVVNASRNKKLEVKRYKEEIDDYRGWESSQEASRRISGIVRRMNKRNKSKGLNLFHCCLNNTNLPNVDLSEANLESSNLEGAYLHSSILQRASLAHANICRTRFVGTNLFAADLSYTFAHRSVFHRANLQYADLRYSELQGAYFDSANLTGVNFYGSIMREVDLTNADVEPYQFKFVSIIRDSIMPDGTTYDNKWAKKIEDSVIPNSYKEYWQEK